MTPQSSEKKQPEKPEASQKPAPGTSMMDETNSLDATQKPAKKSKKSKSKSKLPSDPTLQDIAYCLVMLHSFFLLSLVTLKKSLIIIIQCTIRCKKVEEMVEIFKNFEC